MVPVPVPLGPNGKCPVRESSKELHKIQKSCIPTALRIPVILEMK